MSMRPAGAPAVRAARCGPRPPRMRRSFRSPSTATASSSTRWSARAYPGIVVSDRWNGYSHLDPNRRQVCWSHLQRDFRRHADGLGEQKTFGEQGLPLTEPGVRRLARLPARAPRPRTGSRPRSRRSKPNSGSCSKTPARRSQRNRWHRQFANNLLKVWPALWTFTIDRRGRADQQPRRTRAPRTGHPPKTLARHPKRQRRTVRRTRPLRRHHLPHATPLAVHLPQRTARRPHPRRPIPRAHLRAPGTERLPFGRESGARERRDSRRQPRRDPRADRPPFLDAITSRSVLEPDPGLSHAARESIPWTRRTNTTNLRAPERSSTLGVSTRTARRRSASRRNDPSARDRTFRRHDHRRDARVGTLDRLLSGRLERVSGRHRRRRSTLRTARHVSSRNQSLHPPSRVMAQSAATTRSTAATESRIAPAVRHVTSRDVSASKLPRRSADAACR